jgi:putative transposase
LKLGKHIKTEKVSVKAWQKNWGKSIGFKSPSSFQSELKRKAENAGGTVLMFSTHKTALSQTCLCGNKQKKSLSQRVHHCSVCGLKMQRDILSAYLSRHVDPKTETLSIQLARKSWLGMEQSLLHGWQKGSKQSARTEASPKSPTNSGSELMCNNPIACKESEPVRVNETCTASWNPMPKGYCWRMVGLTPQYRYTVFSRLSDIPPAGWKPGAIVTKPTKVG